MRAVRAVSGVLAAGVVVLTLVVLAAAVLAQRRSIDGPGAGTLVAHGVAAVLVVAAQVWADRGNRGDRAMRVGLGCGVVVVVTAVLLWTQWWA